MIQKITDLKTYALNTNIPIISDEALEFIKVYINENKVKNILEIGGAIGYSAISFSLLGAHVDTFERDETRAKEANKFISDFKADVTLYTEDALTFEGDLSTYDLIFIDAAKAQYEKFFNKYEKYLNDGGVIVCDNLDFHHLKPENVSRSTRQLLKKISNFVNFLKEHPNFKTTFYHLGDGLSVSKKVKTHEISNNTPQTK